MNLFRAIEEAKGLQAPVAATVGNFDGVHRGHRRLIESAVRSAREKGGASVALTFYPHPMQVLALDRRQMMINTLEQRVELLAECGLDAAVLVPFTKEFAAKTPEEFLDVVLATIPIAEFHLGEDFRFGHLNAGDMDLLRREGERRGFRVVAVPFLEHAGRKLGSSAIRRLLGEGRVEEAAALLGRRYFVDGEVVPGESRGKKIGFPTANLRSLNEIIPSPGVYASRMRVDAVWRDAVTNIGFRPTFHLHGGLTVETHLLDFEGDLVGKSVRLEFVKMLREERKFESAEALKKHIATRDIPAAREALRRCSTTSANSSKSSVSS